MNNIAIPVKNLTTANLDSISRFAQSPEIVEATKNSIEQYFSVVQESFMRVTQSNAFSQLNQALASNYQRFADEYTKSVLGLFSQGQDLLRQQVEQGNRRFEQITEAGNRVVKAGVEAGADAANEAEDNADEASSKLEQISKGKQGGRNQR
ncbi:MAG: hypothetical protein H7X91_04720 [Burkholderiales bacterium]|nr:hypothetical protein [Burkholderiales bacterium]